MNTSPGFKLRLFLMQIISRPKPYNVFEEGGAIDKIDYILSADGSLSDAIYMSAINYLVRRLITSADYIYGKFGDTDNSFITNLRATIKNEFGFNKSDNEKILALLVDVCRVSNRPLSTGTKNEIKKEARNQGAVVCYICGRELSFETKEGEDEAIEIEHLWPHSLGGSNEPENLKIACHRCNKYKKSAMDTNDFHFERINYLKFNGLEFTEILAVWAKHDYKCAKCNRPVSDIGSLKINRLNKDDSWHYLNLEPYCSKHFSE